MLRREVTPDSEMFDSMAGRRTSKEDSGPASSRSSGQQTQSETALLSVFGFPTLRIPKSVYPKQGVGRGDGNMTSWSPKTPLDGLVNGHTCCDKGSPATRAGPGNLKA